jgi:acetyltransferase
VDYGYRGKIYPVNPRHSEILGIKVYPSLGEIPGSVDYVISCVPAREVPDMLEVCSEKGVKAVHLYTARFSETGRPEAAELEQEVLKRARRLGIRIIGPNCMGIYYPRQGLSFGYDLPKEPGWVGMMSQSGGGASGFVRLASLRGVRFSKVISYGNALDLNESDYLDYFSQDTETKIILVYIEGVRDGRRFFTALGKAASKKPVIVLKGGKGKSGTTAVASHTASIAGSTKAWEAVVAQTGAISAQNLDEMADLAVSFYFLPPVKGTRVGIVGGGGGPSVLSADECEGAGLDVIALPVEIRDELRSKGIPIWDWIGNPTDVSILGGFGFTDIDMLRMMAGNPNFDLLITNMNEGVLVTLSREEGMTMRLRGAIDSYARVKEESSKPLLAVLGEGGPGIEDSSHWSWQLISEARTKLINANIPFYPTMQRAARAAHKLFQYYQNQR